MDPVAGGWTADLEEAVRQLAISEGFDVCGVSGLDSTTSSLDAARFETWIDQGRAGEMEYLKRRDEAGVLLRSAVQVAMPWAKSVLICAMNYNAGGPLSIDSAEPTTGWIGRYAWSGRAPDPAPDLNLRDTSADALTSLLPADYHQELMHRLERVEAALLTRVQCRTKCYVDTGPLVERTVAARAGIGWIGKNTCVLNQQLGSWLLLAVIVTSLPQGEQLSVVEAADRCGSCTRCIDACPTGALVSERQMDASRCIAYLTIEKKGEIAEDLRAAMGRQVFGCDICQDVCPWNRRSPIALRPGILPRQELINPALEWLAAMDAQEFKRHFKGSPIERTRRKRMLRNVAIAMGNTGQQQFIPQLEEWSRSPDPVLADSARWALMRIACLSEEPQSPPASIKF